MSWNWKITSGKMPSQEVKKLPFGHFSLQNSEHFTLNEHPGSPLKTINNICNRAPFHFSCATFSRGMMSFMFAVVSFFSTRTTLMSQLPRLNLISFTGTLLEVMMICIVVLMFRKMFMKTVLQETWPLPLPSLFLRRTTGTYFTLRFEIVNLNLS